MFKRILTSLALVSVLAIPLIAGKSFFPNGFPDGANIRGLNVLNTYSHNVYYVQNTAGNDSFDGSFNWPFATLDYAIGRTTTGDIIIMKEGHNDDVVAAAGINVDVPSITIVGLGRGTDRPSITFKTLTTADMDIDAANVTLCNIRFICQKDALVSMLDVNATNPSIIDCDFSADATYQPLEFINVATASVRTKIEGCTIKSATAGANHAIRIHGTGDGIEIIGNKILGDWANAGIYSNAVFTNAIIANNFILNTQTGDHAIELTAAATGLLVNNALGGTAVGAILDPGAMYYADRSATQNVNYILTP